MKPIIRTTDNSIHDGSGGYIAQLESLIPLAIETYLFTADQLKAAQVAVLREAAAMWSIRGRISTEYEDVVRTDELRRMADELEKPLPAALHEIPKREDGINAAGGTLSNNIGNPT